MRYKYDEAKEHVFNNVFIKTLLPRQHVVNSCPFLAQELLFLFRRVLLLLVLFPQALLLLPLP